jgi:hypothetical protein
VNCLRRHGQAYPDHPRLALLNLGKDVYARDKPRHEESVFPSERSYATSAIAAPRASVFSRGFAE